MKKLYLLRHAEAEKKTGQSDFERSLTSFGEFQAELLGEHMKENSIIPNLIICSDAIRTKQTLHAINKSLKLSHNALVYEHKIYNSSVEELENQILHTKDSVDSLMLIAHNPAITTLPLKLQLSGKIAGLYDFNSTCKFVSINLELTSWDKLLSAKGTVENIICPGLPHH